MKKSKKQNGRWDNALIKECVALARKTSNAHAMRECGIPHSTFYGWLRRPEFKKKKK